MHRLVEMIPEKTFEPDGAFRITFIDRAVNLETRVVSTKREALVLHDLWMNNEALPDATQSDF